MVGLYDNLTGKWEEKGLRIFVYGTLRKGQPAYNRMSLQHRTKYIGETVIPGTLYTLGSFPALRLAPHKPGMKMGLVKGDLLEINGNNALLEEIDKYEGYEIMKPEDSLYQRVMFQKGGMKGWVYEFKKPIPDDKRVIEGGDWLEHIKTA